MIGGYEQNNLDRSAGPGPSARRRGSDAAPLRFLPHRANALPPTVCDEIVAPPWEDMSPDDPRRKFSRHLHYNLSRPDKSSLLLAPWPKAGGLALCQTNARAAGLQGQRDPDYQTILAALKGPKRSWRRSNALTCRASWRDRNGIRK